MQSFTGQSLGYNIRTIEVGYGFTTILSERQDLLEYQITFSKNPGCDLFVITLSYTLLLTLTMTQCRQPLLFNKNSIDHSGNGSIQLFQDLFPSRFKLKEFLLQLVGLPPCHRTRTMASPSGRMGRSLIDKQSKLELLVPIPIGLPRKILLVFLFAASTPHSFWM